MRISFLICSLVIIHGTFEEVLNNDDVPELKYINPNVDPCEDFYEFTCGNFKNYHGLNNQPVANQFTLVGDDMLNIVKRILGQPPIPGDPISVRKIKMAYSACLNEDYIPGLKLPEVSLMERTGRMPMLQLAPKTKFGWNEIAGLVADYGVAILFDFQAIPYPITTYDNLLHITEDKFPNPTLMRPSHERTHEDVIHEDMVNYAFENAKLKPEATKAPFDIYLERVMKTLRDTVDMGITDEILDQRLQDVSAFMRNIYNYKGTAADIEAIGSTVGDLQKWTDKQFGPNLGMNWIEYLNKVLKRSGQKVTNDSYISADAEYVYHILSVVKITDPNTIKNFAMLRILLFSSIDSRSEIRNAFINYYKAKNYTLYARPDYCARKLMDATDTASVSFAVAYSYQRYHFNNNKLSQASEMISDIQSVFKSLLQDLDWMDDVSKAAALRKVDNMITILAIPELAQDAEQLDKFYENLKICAWDHYGNSQRIRALKQAYQLSQIGKSRIREFWDKSPFEANAYYNRANNKIIFPIAMLNPVFFTGKSRKIDYSHIGVIIAHEITHGFDERGQAYDENAVLKAWWSNATYDEFKNRTQCFKDQYSKYFIPELNVTVNGESCINENLADNGGIRTAFKAIKNQLQNMTLSSGRYTDEQLFFIGYGTTFCAIEPPAYLQYLQATEYAPSKYRVIGPISNMVEFAEAFNCPVGSPMNPKNKCVLW